jgi:DNA gyrase inhibitor GyrI
MLYLITAVVIVAIAYLGWKMTARGNYESAEYTAIETDGPFEIREYPDLMLASTAMKFESQGDDGSFNRLFQYISGENADHQKVAMTTPVFMEPENPDSRDQKTEAQMGFVIPKKVAQQSIPNPDNQNVQIRKREGGRFAVMRFAGRMNDKTLSEAQDKLRKWMETKELTGASGAEFAGYDPPWTPGPLRRNEVLIRLR